MYYFEKIILLSNKVIVPLMRLKFSSFNNFLGQLF